MLQSAITNSSTMIVMSDESNKVTPVIAYAPSAKISVTTPTPVFRWAHTTVGTT